MYMLQKVHSSHYVEPEWVERQKRKMIILQELVAINTRFLFIKMDGNINNNKWREWKRDHGVSYATYNILLYQLPKGFWLVRLTNKGKLKRANNIIKKFPTILSIFWKFLALKATFRKWERRICLRS